MGLAKDGDVFRSFDDTKVKLVFFPKRLQSGCINVYRVTRVRGRMGWCGSMHGGGGFIFLDLIFVLVIVIVFAKHFMKRNQHYLRLPPHSLLFFAPALSVSNLDTFKEGNADYRS